MFCTYTLSQQTLFLSIVLLRYGLNCYHRDYFAITVIVDTVTIRFDLLYTVNFIGVIWLK